MVVREAALLEREQLLEAVEEVVGSRVVLAPAQCVGGDRIGATCTTRTSVSRTS
jgi:hypothetical protein